VVTFPAVRQEEQSLTLSTPLLFTAVAISATVLVALIEGASLTRALTLFLGFEGTALLASVLLNTLLAPPQGFDLWEWFFIPQTKTIGVVLRQPLLYLGIICLLAQETLKA
jgi:hypothetical protein